LKKQAVLASAFITSRNRVLLLKRSKTDLLSHEIWELPSGTVEFGESPNNALRREVMEETGLRISSSRAFYMVSYVKKHRNLLLHTVEISFLTRVSRNGIVNLNPREHSEFRWVSKSSLPHLRLGPSTKEVVLKGFDHLKLGRTNLSSSYSRTSV
jgi:8-oxo-dGTP diphosphatase